MRVSRLAAVAATAVLLLTPLFSVPSRAGEDGKKSTAKEDEKEVVVITTEDLVARYGESEDAGAPSTPTKEDGEANHRIGTSTRKDSRVPAAEPPGKNADERKGAIESELERLEKRVASLRNPFLPRVAETDKEKEAESGMDNAEKVRRLEARIAALRAELATLK